MLSGYQRKYFERAGQRGISRCCNTALVTQNMQGNGPMRRSCKCSVIIRENILNTRGSVRAPDIVARRYWVTCLPGHFTKEDNVTAHMQIICLMQKYCKCSVMIRQNISNARSSIRSPDIGTRLNWVTCLLGHFSEEGNGTQHMQGTWLMPRYCKCWMFIRKNMLNARGSVKSPDIAARR